MLILFDLFFRGLKGTSKPVHYRCIHNENYLFKKKKNLQCLQLTADVLKDLTFGLSFQYGTATKATRSIAVLQYADRLANAALGYSDAIELSGQISLTGEGAKLPSFRNHRSDNETHSFHCHYTA